MAQDAAQTGKPAELTQEQQRSIKDRLASMFRAHRPDPTDPEHRCLCGFDGESYDDHLADYTLRQMKEVGYEIRPVRYI